MFAGAAALAPTGELSSWHLRPFNRDCSTASLETSR